VSSLAALYLAGIRSFKGLDIDEPGIPLGAAFESGSPAEIRTVYLPGGGRLPPGASTKSATKRSFQEKRPSQSVILGHAKDLANR
jgi:hypothetical protein